MIGDFNGDGKLDMVVGADQGDSRGAILVLLGNSDGTFQPFVPYPAIWAFGGVVGDFNRDGKLDLIIVGPDAHTQQSVMELPGNGDGTFQAGTLLPSGTINPDAITSADFNGDSKADLAITNAASNSVSILLSNQ